MRAYFTRAVREQFGRAEDRLVGYLGELLGRFAHCDRIYTIHALDGRRLFEVAEMLEEGDVRLNATSFDREREVHRHIGDFTLFWTGVFPDAVPRLTRFGKDQLIDYVRQGKQSYHIVSTFELGEYRDEAPLFRQLSEQFETCMRGLRQVRDRWVSFEA